MGRMVDLSCLGGGYWGDGNIYPLSKPVHIYSRLLAYWIAPTWYGNPHA